jgi:hypothetical protein
VRGFLLLCSFVLPLAAGACGGDPEPECSADEDCPGDATCSASGTCVAPPRDAGPSAPDTGPPPATDAGPAMDAGDGPPPPPVPVPRRPAQGATTGSVHGSVVLPEPALRPRFAWDASPGAERYELQVSSECETPGFAACAFAAPEVNETTPETSYRTGLLEVSTTPPVGRRYYWRVRACAARCSAWSPVRYVDVGRLPNDFDGDGYSDLLAGAHADDGAQSNQGRAYWWPGGPGGPASPTHLTPPRVVQNGNFGIATAALGDVNADGFADAAVAGHRIHSGAEDTGEVYLYLGSADGLPEAPSLVVPPPVAESRAWFGRALAPAGDVNGDGFADLLVGAHGEDAGGSDRGRAYLFHGGVDPDPSPATVLDAPEAQDDQQFGFQAAGVGDVDGNGFADVLVAARRWDGEQTNQGRLYLFAGGADGLSDRVARTFDDPAPSENAELGWGVAAAGDLNGDAFTDVLFGGRRRAGTGGVLLFLGGPTGPAATPDLDLLQPDGQASAEYGFAVAGVRDVNGDGIGDALIGARLFDRSDASEGRAYLHYGGEAGLSSEADLVLNGSPRESGAQFGYSVGAAGDVNGDGVGDAIVGAYNQDTSTTSSGGLFFYLGGTDGLAGAGTLLASPRSTDGRLGVSVAVVPAW